jgi:hypothetical protein
LEEIDMAQVSLQLGAALVVPFAAPLGRVWSGGNWRLRALRAAVKTGDFPGWSARRRRRRAKIRSNGTARGGAGGRV